MPLYEYICPECKDTFEALRPAPEADAPVACPTCRQLSTQRILSLFARSVKTSLPDTTPVSVGGCGCGSGACGCH
jgi:putative FmdB family regulatory protein